MSTWADMEARTGMEARRPECFQIPAPADCYPAGTTWSGYVPVLPRAPSGSTVKPSMTEEAARAAQQALPPGVIPTPEEQTAAPTTGFSPWLAFGLGVLGGSLAVFIVAR